MEYYIEDLSNKNATDWKTLNEESKEGSFFHTLKWKSILEQSFNYKTHYFLIYRNDKPVAICPFYEDMIQGIRGLVSLPTSDYNHIIITDKSDSLILNHILDKCKDIALKYNLFFIVITSLSELTKNYINRYNPLPYPITGNMVLNLEELSPDKIWNDILSQRDRRYIRKFEKDGFRIKEVKSIEDVKIYYKYYKENLKSIKATPYPFSHFEKLLNIYSSKEMILTLLYNNENIAGGQLIFLHNNKKTMHLRYLSLNRNLPNKYRPTLFLNWDSIKRASEIGYNRICFGKTPPYPKENHFQLKEKFGCQFEKEYSIIFPRSYLFKFGYNIYYNIYSKVKKYKHGRLVE